MSIDEIIKEQVLKAKRTKAESIIYARQMKNQFPSKQDYGYGEAGHTLNNWEEMKKAFELYGPRTAANQSHKMISQTYRKRVGAIIDDIVAKSKIDSTYLGRFCWSGTVDQFVHSTKAQWLAHMTQQYNTVSPFSLKRGQKEAWSTSYSALKNALRKNSNLKNALLVFEYAIPHTTDNGGVKALNWPDALIVTDKKILVLEFKNFPLETDKLIKDYLSQARKYKGNLREYHVESKEKRIKCILVSTKMQHVFQKVGRNSFCSGDMLCEALKASCSGVTRPFDRDAWLNSPFYGIQK